MKRTALAALIFAAALPAAAFDWTNADPLAQFGAALAKMPAPAPVVAKFCEGSKKETDTERFTRIVSSIMDGEAVTQADVDWARANIDRMMRKLGVNRTLRRKTREANDRLPEELRVGWAERRAYTQLTKMITRLQFQQLFDNARILK